MKCLKCNDTYIHYNISKNSIVLCDICQSNSYLDSDKKLIRDMEELLIQATIEKSHYYVRDILTRAIKALKDK